MCLGIPGRVEEILESTPLERMGRVSFGGICKEVCLAYVPEAEPGDYVIVHVGFAISRIQENEAQRTLSYLEQLGNAVDAK